MAKGITAQEMDSATASGLVPHLGTTTNSGNAYSITTSADVKPNTKFTLKINAASTGAPTLKINDRAAAPIKRAGNKDAKLLASVYTLFWDGAVFTLQGEGGGGTARPDQVEAGFTFTNDSGEQTGTLSKQEFVDAINSKGVTTTMSDPFNQLPNKIKQINTPSRSYLPYTTDEYKLVRYVDYWDYKDLFLIPASQKYVDVYSIKQTTVAFKPDAIGVITDKQYAHDELTVYASITLIDGVGTKFNLKVSSTTFTEKANAIIWGFSIDRISKSCLVYDQMTEFSTLKIRSLTLPENFDVTGPIRVCAGHMRDGNTDRYVGSNYVNSVIVITT